MGPVVSSPHSLGVLKFKPGQHAPKRKKSENSLDDLVKVVPRHRPRRLRRLWQPTPLTRLTDRPGDQPSPTVLVIRTESTTVVTVEELVEEEVVPEVRVPVQLGVPAVARSSAFFVSRENVDQSMLDLFCGTGQRDVLQEIIS
jgi:hypothetical protein